MRLVVLGNPGSNRLTFLNEALQRRGLPAATLVPWLDLIEERLTLADVLLPGDVVRLESPGRDAAVEAALVGQGRQALPGELFFPARWYAGFCKALERVAVGPEQRLLNDPGELMTLFDKQATHARFATAGLPVPRTLPSPSSLAELADAMRARKLSQVFVKLAHGSSAAGALALRTDGQGRWRGYTTVEQAGETLYNSRRLRQLDTPEAVGCLIQALAPHTLHVEEWLPKATWQGGAFDLRALVIGGKLRHVVARLSRSPITNLHLLNRRAPAEAVRERVGEAAWSALTELAERAATCFPKSLHLGLDILWLPGFRRLALLEANAFGDLLPGTLWEGKSTYEVELEALGC